ncbi:Variant surface glycoprotein [Trypanosoma congolense IL3000]|uniref:Variant surface glycoprotein n=1 Tax=Trypanosoma congolense (strain IL3000) TaxID=1068625 RepID=F9WK77_TRYCI|nr:Variant surface glycoprotein [Trypanosoma congolense IL3000]
MGILEQRRIINGIMVMVVSVAMECVWAGFTDYKKGHNFNGHEHDALCEVFKATADLWETSTTSKKKLGNDLENALRQALFGNTRTMHLGSITSTMPSVHHNIGHRGWRCGSCANGDAYSPGSSIPHDLMCLCTPGYYSEPFYAWWWDLWWHYEETKFLLCGKKREDMVSDQYQGWYVDKGTKVAKGLDKPWKAVVWGCFDNRNKGSGTGNPDLEEKVKKLKTTMQKFTTLLKVVGLHHKLGGTMNHTASDGRTEENIHVHYTDCAGRSEPWWKKLNRTLTKKKDSSSKAPHGVPSYPREIKATQDLNTNSTEDKFSLE